MPVPDISGLSLEEAARKIRSHVLRHEGPFTRHDVLAILSATLHAAADAANTRDTFTALRLRGEAKRMR